MRKKKNPVNNYLVTTFIIFILFTGFSSSVVLADNHSPLNDRIESEFGVFEGNKSSENFSLQDNARGFILKDQGQESDQSQTTTKVTSTGYGNLLNFNSLMTLLPIIASILLFFFIAFVLFKWKKRSDSKQVYQNN